MAFSLSEETHENHMACVGLFKVKGTRTGEGGKYGQTLYHDVILYQTRWDRLFLANLVNKISIPITFSIIFCALELPLQTKSSKITHNDQIQLKGSLFW